MKKTTIITYLAWTMAAAAHPGHDAALPADSVAHWLFSPLHGLGVVALARSLRWCGICAARGTVMSDQSIHQPSAGVDALPTGPADRGRDR